MLFNSVQFLFIFLPIVAGTCFLAARLWGARVAKEFLVLSSLAFYGVWNWVFLPLLLGSIVCNYVVARAILRSEIPRKRLLLYGAVAFNLGLLGYYKYAGFLVQSVDELTGMNWSVAAIALPLGISFYTFQQITLLIDVRQGRVKDFRFRDFILFVTFFPHLIAGPIVHHKEMMPQFERASFAFVPTNIAVGLTLFFAGLFKKTVLADGIAPNLNAIFTSADAGHAVPMLDGWLAAMGFTLQIYFDFSGYSEMALGLARLFGILLPVNFYSPLKARDIIEFWSRWHMTLTRFLTAYVYNPFALALTRRHIAAGRPGLAGPRTTALTFLVMILCPTMLTMFLSGLWHGAGNQFLVFGLLHGAYLVIANGWRLYRPARLAKTAGYRRFMEPAGTAMTLCAVALAQPFFRAANLPSAMRMIGSMTGLADPASVLPVGGTALTLAWVAGLLAIALLCPNVIELMRSFQPAISIPAFKKRPNAGVVASPAWRPSAGWAIATGIAAAASLIRLGDTTDFLYWQF